MFFFITLNSSFLLKSLGEGITKRQSFIDMFVQSRALHCSIDFSRFLQTRNYCGNLKFDHENLELDVTVRSLGSASRADEGTNLRSLSGGERSFSTVALLLSLWSVVESPVMFLDEFDVFMVSFAFSSLIINETNGFHLITQNRVDHKLLVFSYKFIKETSVLPFLDFLKI